MQTFLPYSSFFKSALVLDNKRLGKQRVEALQIFNALNSQTGGWINHPAVKMWKNYQSALLIYGATICQEWRKRGFKDTVLEKLKKLWTGQKIELPPFLGNSNFHLSHQSNLLRKDYQHYSKYFKNIPNNLPYVWKV